MEHGALSRSFGFKAFDNLYVLQPTAYVDGTDDANPVLESRVFSRYAFEEIIQRVKVGH